jgi:hypothetical protein
MQASLHYHALTPTGGSEEGECGLKRFKVPLFNPEMRVIAQQEEVRGFRGICLHLHLCKKQPSKPQLGAEKEPIARTF